jgi:hypothetical protein
LLVSVSTQDVPQQVSPATQSLPVPPQRQVPDMHCSLGSQDVEQFPQ